MPTPSTTIRVENWKDLVDIVGVLRPANSTDSISSVELKNLSSGAVQATVKTYDPDPYQAMKTAEDIYQQLKERYNF